MLSVEGERALRRWIKRRLKTVGRLDGLLRLDPLASWLARPLLIRPNLHSQPFIVALGGGIRSSGRLNDATSSRVRHAVRLFKARLAPQLILSGGPGAPHRPNCALNMKALAEVLGVPPSCIIVEGQSSRTTENAREVGRILRVQQVSSVLLVTSPLHMRRAKRCFEREAITVWAAPAPPLAPRGSSRRPSLLEEVLQEYLGLAYYRIRGWI
jgi:uncharacterized SAM-binding protein YcdF (DUF218 family)